MIKLILTSLYMLKYNCEHDCCQKKIFQDPRKNQNKVRNCGKKGQKYKSCSSKNRNINTNLIICIHHLFYFCLCWWLHRQWNQKLFPIPLSRFIGLYLCSLHHCLSSSINTEENQQNIYIFFWLKHFYIDPSFLDHWWKINWKAYLSINPSMRQQ